MNTTLEITQTYYDILSVPIDASMDDIKKAYRTLSQLYHPDKITQTANASNTANNLNTEQAPQQKYLAIQHAWSVLSSPEQKLQYDAELSKVAQKQKMTEQAHYTFSIDDFEPIPHDDDEDFITFHTTCRCTDALTFTSDDVAQSLEQDEEVLITICPGCSLRYKVILG